MGPRNRLLVLPLLNAVLLTALLFLNTLPLVAQQVSPTRIIRLSFVEGRVTVERTDVQGWAEAPVNTPIEQGFRLATAEGSFAEIQLENGGAMRIGEGSVITFSELSRDSNGVTVNRVNLSQGYATFHLQASRLGGGLQVETPIGVLSASGASEFRVDLDQGTERVEVIDGAVEEQSSVGSMTVEKDSVLILQPGAAQPLGVSQGISQDDWDQWVAGREAAAPSLEGAPPPEGYAEDGSPYGWSELSQNGSWTEVDGEGYGWAPNVAAGWSPYSSGEWCWYGGLGYVWIGAESWGWLPYHYGGWQFVPTNGWIWFPDNLSSWSPGQVAWYQGPNWIGWAPKPPHHVRTKPCAVNCGGGVVGANAFRQGGQLNPNRMLGVSIATGTWVTAPTLTPGLGARLTGSPAHHPDSTRHSVTPPSQPTQTRSISSAAPADGTIRGAISPPRSAVHPTGGIVYDPQQGSYINAHRAPRTPAQPAFAPPPTATVPPVARTGVVPPASEQGRESHPVVVPPLGQTSNTPTPAGVYASPSSVVQPPVSSAPATHSATPSPQPTVPAQPSGNRSGGWAPASRGSGGSPAPAGGGHSASSAGPGGGARH